LEELSLAPKNGLWQNEKLRYEAEGCNEHGSLKEAGIVERFLKKGQ